MNAAAYVRHKVDELPVHICQKFSYEWFLRLVGERNIRGKRIFDFGPGGYPFGAFLAKLDGEVSWLDRNPQVRETMIAISRKWRVPLPERKTLDGQTVDIILASNAVQHNRTGAELIFGLFAKMLAPGGYVLLSEKLAQGESRWIADRDDPCWARTLADHERVWAAGGLRATAIAGFVYEWNPDPAQEWARWTSLSGAVQVVAKLEKAE